MRTMRWLGAAAAAALGLAAAAFVGGVSPAEAGEKGLPVRLADAEQTLTIHGESLSSLQQQVLTISGENFGARIEAESAKLQAQINELRSELAEARKENAELRALLGSEVKRLDARIDALAG